MSGLQDMIGKGDGISSQTKMGLKQAGVYEPPPPPPPPPQAEPTRSQVGSTQLGNEEGLRKALKARGLTDAQIDEKVQLNKQQKGFR